MAGKGKKYGKKRLNKYVWVEKYRPDSVKTTILPSRHMNFFKSIIKDGEIPNLLLHSVVPGSGKTTISRAICKDIGVNPLYINISNERGISVLRDTIAKHASIKTMSGKPKVIILDEFDNSTPDLQKALRADIEKYSNSCRFIMTANYIHKIIDPLREGRVMEFDFNMTDEETKKEMHPKILKRLCGILKTEGIEYDKETLSGLVEQFYPNVRKMISILQKYGKTNGQIDKNIFKMAQVDEQFYQYLLEKNLTNARQFILDNNYDFGELYTDLYHNFVPMLEKESQPQAILLIAQYQYESAFAINKEIPFIACLIELMNDCV